MVLLKNALFYQKKMKKRHSQGNTPICGLTYTNMKIKRVSQFLKTGQVGCWQVGSENVSARPRHCFWFCLLSTQYFACNSCILSIVSSVNHSSVLCWLDDGI